MEMIGEIIFGFLAEIVITVVGEAFVELGFHSLAERLGQRFWKRVFVGSLYAVGALALGALSLNVLPVMVFSSRAIAIVYFIVAPIVAGFAMCFVSWIINRGIDDRGFFVPTKFAYGVIFAFVFSVTRTIFG